jgi:hypothetical protein
MALGRKIEQPTFDAGSTGEHYHPDGSLYLRYVIFDYVPKNPNPYR